MACPGPVFSRILEGAFTGQLGKKPEIGSHGLDNRRMNTSRCAQLMAIALVNKLDEVMSNRFLFQDNHKSIAFKAWISIQPILTFYYISQYFPTISHKLFPRFFTPERMARFREGHKWSMIAPSLTIKCQSSVTNCSFPNCLPLLAIK